MLSATARVELGPEHIRVLTFYPGRTETAFGQNAIGSQQIREALSARVSQSGMDSPELVAERILAGVEDETPDISMEDLPSGVSAS